MYDIILVIIPVIILVSFLSIRGVVDQLIPDKNAKYPFGIIPTDSEKRVWLK